MTFDNGPLFDSYVSKDRISIPPPPRRNDSGWTGLGCLLAAILFVVALPAVTLLNAVIVSTFWRWFLMPVFPSLEPISIVQSMGIALFARLFTNTDTSSDSDSRWWPMAKLFAQPAITLAFGWIILQLMY